MISNHREEPRTVVALLSYPKVEYGGGTLVASHLPITGVGGLPWPGYNLEGCTCLQARAVSKEESSYGHQSV